MKKIREPSLHLEAEATQGGLLLKSGRNVALAGTLALVCVPRLCQVAGAVTVGSNSSVRYPGFVHTSLHALHDQIQQNLHGMAHVLTVRSACLKVWDTARRQIKWISIKIPTEFGTSMLPSYIYNILDIIHYNIHF